MSENNDHEEKREKSRSNARNFGGFVYVGGTVAASVLFLTFILTAFPADAYFSRVVMTLAALAVGCSMLAFPVALHNWVVTKNHRIWGVFLYYGEMAIIAVNTVVSFVSLLAKYGNYTPPEWTILYEPFAVVSIIYTIAAWGTVFLLDPEHLEYAADQEARARLKDKVEKIKLKYLDTQEGERLAAQMADAEILADWTVNKHLKSKGLNAPIPAPAVFRKNEAVSPSPLPKVDGEET